MVLNIVCLWVMYLGGGDIDALSTMKGGLRGHFPKNATTTVKMRKIGYCTGELALSDCAFMLFVILLILFAFALIFGITITKFQSLCFLIFFREFKKTNSLIYESTDT